MNDRLPYWRHQIIERISNYNGCCNHHDKFLNKINYCLGSESKYYRKDKLFICRNKIISVDDYYGGFLALTDDGNVYAYGDNSYSRLGIGLSEYKYLGIVWIQHMAIDMCAPIKLAVNNIIKICLLSRYSVLLNNLGQIYISGIRITDNSSKCWGKHHLVKRFNNIVDFRAFIDELILIDNLRDEKVYKF
jgi:alpha-tubulin suppressor-like RCC1 family protein